MPSSGAFLQSQGTLKGGTGQGHIPSMPQTRRPVLRPPFTPGSRQEPASWGQPAKADIATGTSECCLGGDALSPSPVRSPGSVAHSSFSLLLSHQGGRPSPAAAHHRPLHTTLFSAE